ncbi:MAG TPA: sugar ABC transporter substrate-binding protein [Mycobacteriales bacterium]|jgi:multiple sugar transport system substrate-binding protein
MRRSRLAAALSAALPTALLAGLVACSDGATNPGATPSGGAGLSGTITVQAAGGEGELNALRSMIAAFETAHPGTKVELTGLAEQGEHIAKLGTAFAGGTPPDVFLLNYRRFGRFAQQGVIDPPALPAGEYYRPSLDAFTYGGRLLCMPQNISSSVVYYNVKLFADAGVAPPRAGWTFADLESTAAALKAKGVKTIGFETGFRTVPAFVWARGGEVVDSTDKPSVITLGTPEARGALEYLKRLLDNGGVTATDAAAASAEDRFAQGELAMFVDSRRAVPAFRKAAGLDFDVAPLPKDKTAATLLASDAYCVAKASKNAALAREFARYAVGPDGGKVLAESGRTVPSLKSLAESAAYLAPDQKPKSARVWLDVIPTVRRLPNVANWNEAESTATDLLEQYFAGKASLDATVTGIEKESRRVLAQEG